LTNKKNNCKGPVARAAIEPSGEHWTIEDWALCGALVRGHLAEPGFLSLSGYELLWLSSVRKPCDSSRKIEPMCFSDSTTIRDFRAHSGSPNRWMCRVQIRAYSNMTFVIAANEVSQYRNSTRDVYPEIRRHVSPESNSDVDNQIILPRPGCKWPILKLAGLHWRRQAGNTPDVLPL
jgi:hypothetical protein